jgi:hypothetical protein
MLVLIISFIFVYLIICLRSSEPFVTEENSLDRYQFAVDRQKFAALCCDEEDNCRTFTEISMLTPQDLEGTFSTIKLKKNFSALLFNQPLNQFEAKVPTLGESVLLYTSDDDNYEKRVPQKFTHMVASENASSLIAYNNPDITCHEMQNALTSNKWVTDTCLPPELRDKHCGLQQYGFRQGNYMGIPTKCHDLVGSTFHDIGLKTKYGISNGATLTNPAKSFLSKNFARDQFEYPIAVPFFYEFYTDTGGETVAVSTERNLPANRKRCENVYLCPVNSKEELDSQLSSVDTLDLSKCSFQSSTC